MWNGVCDPEIGKFNPWFCESPPWLLGEHRMGYKETDSGSTVSSQGLKGGEERISCRLHLLLAEDATYVPRLSVPDFVPQLQWREQDMGRTACYKARYFSWPKCWRPHIGNMHYASNTEGRRLYLPWHTGWVFLQSAPDHPLLPHVCPAAHLIVWAYMLGYVQCPAVVLLTNWMKYLLSLISTDEHVGSA